jgi:uncharacterized protein (TIGR04255 family)
METVVNINPLIANPPEEVPLKAAPLIFVIAQVRFPPILSIEDSSFVAPFQEAIREQYPILQLDKIDGLIFGAEGLTPTKKMIWRFVDSEANWRVSLTSNSISLDTVAYLSRKDFIARLENVLKAIELHIKPQLVERFGLRYVDRIVNQDIKDISKLVRPEIAGILATEIGGNIHQTINESLFYLPERKEQIMARWGLIPAHATIDPVVEPIEEPSWILDLDMSLSEQRTFNVEELLSETQQFSERIYTFFRWAVTDEFLQRFGGKI